MSKKKQLSLPVFRPGNPINNSIIIRYGLIDGHFLWLAIDSLFAWCVVNVLFRLHAVDVTCSVCHTAEHEHSRFDLCCSVILNRTFSAHNCILLLINIFLVFIFSPILFCFGICFTSVGFCHINNTYQALELDFFTSVDLKIDTRKKKSCLFFVNCYLGQINKLVE